MEWTSIILFTVLSEAAVGLLLTWWLFGFTAVARNQAEAYGKLGRQVLLSAGLTTGVAMLVSLEHLGWPLSSPRVLMGLGHSWLSWEVVLTGLFALGSLLLWYLARRGAASQTAVGLLALVGFAATYTSGMIYSLKSIPANAGGFPVLLFIATALVTGATLLITLLAATPEGNTLAPVLATPLSLFAAAGVILAASLALAYAGAAAHGAPEARAQAALLTGSAWHLIRLLAGLLLPAAWLLWLARQPRLSAFTAALPALLVVAGELTGRFLFFTSMVTTSINSGF